MDESLETAVAVLDWAMHTGELDEFDFQRLILRIAADRRGIATFVDPNCESLPESLARTRLRLAGHEVVGQAPLGDAQRIDLVVDGQVALEVDGEAFHWNRFEPDREKDIDITLTHRHSIRPSANAVFHRWSRVALAVDTALTDRGAIPENSGDKPKDPFRARGLKGWRRPRRRRNPEFSKWGRGKAWGMSGNNGLPVESYPMRD